MVCGKEELFLSIVGLLNAVAIVLFANIKVCGKVPHATKYIFIVPNNTEHGTIYFPNYDIYTLKMTKNRCATCFYDLYTPNPYVPKPKSIFNIILF